MKKSIVLLISFFIFVSLSVYTLGATIYSEGFEDGTLGGFTADDPDFQVYTSPVYSGSYSAGIIDDNGDSQLASNTVFPGGREVETFSFYYQEDGSSTGGGAIVEDSSGNKVAGIFTDNDEWVIYEDGGFNQIRTYDNIYNVWYYGEITFNWGNGNFDYYIERLSDGTTETGTGTLGGNNVESIVLYNYHSVNGGISSDGIEQHFDDFEITGTVQNNPPSLSNLEPSDGNKKVLRDVELNATYKDSDGDTGEVGFYSNNTIYETGTFENDGSSWTTINTQNTYENPIVIATVNTQNDAESPHYYKIRNVQSDSFEAKFCEHESTDGGCDSHSLETVAYLVAEEDELDQISGIEAGTVNLNADSSSSAETINLDESLTSTTVIASSQTYNEAGEMNIQVPSTSSNSFDMYLCDHDESDTDSCETHGTEEVAWIAIDSDKRFKRFESGTTTAISDSGYSTESFDNVYDSTPVVFATINSNEGGQEAKPSMVKSVTTSGADVGYCEHDGSDTCDGHAGENIGWLVLRNEIGYEEIGTQTNIADNTKVTQQFNNLNEGTTYDWYAIADDGITSNKSSVFSFTTKSKPDKPYNPDPKDNETDVPSEYSLSARVKDPDGDDMNVTIFVDGVNVEEIDNVVNGSLVSTPTLFFDSGSYHTWYVVAEDKQGSTTGDTWNFTVAIPPNKPKDPYPEDNSRISETTSTELSINVTDPEEKQMDVCFYNASNDSEISCDNNVSSGSRASITWNNLVPGNTYSWYAISEKDGFTNKSDTFNFTINNNPNIIYNSPIDNKNDTNLSVLLNVTYEDPDLDKGNVSFSLGKIGKQEFVGQEDDNTKQTPYDQDPPIDIYSHYLNYNGNYGSNGNISWRDGNYSTFYGPGDDSITNLSINYTKPRLETDNIIWEVIDGDGDLYNDFLPNLRYTNITIPEECENAYENKINLRVKTVGAGTIGSLCLSPDTKLETKNNGTKKIKNLNLWEKVLSYNKDEDKNEYHYVTDILNPDAKYYNNKLYEINTKNNKVNSTYNHFFYTKYNGKVIAKNLTKDMYLKTEKGYEKIKQVKKYDYKGKVYDISVLNNHNFYANGLLAKNTQDVIYYCYNGNTYQELLSHKSFDGRLVEERIYWNFSNIKETNKKFNNVENGTTLTYEVENLKPGLKYSWYAKANDGYATFTGEERTFTTSYTPNVKLNYPLNNTLGSSTSPLLNITYWDKEANEGEVSIYTTDGSMYYYQEFASLSKIRYPFNYSGEYIQNNSWKNKENAIDGDFNTYATWGNTTDDDDNRSLYITYYLNNKTNDIKWEVKDDVTGRINITIPDYCKDYYSNKIRLRVLFFNETGVNSGTISYGCYRGYWESQEASAAYDTTGFYEEALNINYSKRRIYRETNVVNNSDVTYEWNLPNEQKTYEWYGVSYDGNSYNKSGIYNFKTDTTPPNITNTDQYDLDDYDIITKEGQSLVLEANVNDTYNNISLVNASVFGNSYDLNIVNEDKYNTTLTVPTGLTDGYKNWTIFANDTLDNRELIQINNSILIDNTPPYYYNISTTPDSVNETTIVNTSVNFNDTTSNVENILFYQNITGTFENTYNCTGNTYCNRSINTTGEKGKQICWYYTAEDTPGNINNTMNYNCFFVNGTYTTDPNFYNSTGSKRQEFTIGTTVTIRFNTTDDGTRNSIRESYLSLFDPGGNPVIVNETTSKFYDGFDTDASAWDENIDSDWTVDSGYYKYGYSANYFSETLVNQTYLSDRTDATITTDLNVKTDAEHTSRIILRYKDDNNYIAAYASHFYSVVGIEEVHEGTRYNTETSKPFSLDTFYEMKIRVANGEATLYWNDDEILTRNIQYVTEPGRLGLMTDASEVWYDNFTVGLEDSSETEITDGYQYEFNYDIPLDVENVGTWTAKSYGFGSYKDSGINTFTVSADQPIIENIKVINNTGIDAGDVRSLRVKVLHSNPNDIDKNFVNVTDNKGNILIDYNTATVIDSGNDYKLYEYNYTPNKNLNNEGDWKFTFFVNDSSGDIDKDDQKFYVNVPSPEIRTTKTFYKGTEKYHNDYNRKIELRTYIDDEDGIGDINYARITIKDPDGVKVVDSQDMSGSDPFTYGYKYGNNPQKAGNYKIEVNASDGDYLVSENDSTTLYWSDINYSTRKNISFVDEFNINRTETTAIILEDNKNNLSCNNIYLTDFKGKQIGHEIAKETTSVNNRTCIVQLNVNTSRINRDYKVYYNGTKSQPSLLEDKYISTRNDTFRKINSSNFFNTYNENDQETFSLSRTYGDPDGDGQTEVFITGRTDNQSATNEHTYLRVLNESYGIEFQDSWQYGLFSGGYDVEIGNFIDSNPGKELAIAGYVYNSSLGHYQGILEYIDYGESGLTFLDKTTWHDGATTQAFTLSKVNLDGDSTIELISGGVSQSGTEYAEFKVWNGTTILDTDQWGLGNQRDRIFTTTVGDIDNDGTQELIGSGTTKLNYTNCEGGLMLNSTILIYNYTNGQLNSELIYTYHKEDLTEIFGNTVGDIDGDGVEELITSGNWYNCTAGNDISEIRVWEYDSGSISLKDQTEFEGQGHSSLLTVLFEDVNADYENEIFAGGFKNDGLTDRGYQVILTYNGELKLLNEKYLYQNAPIRDSDYSDNAIVLDINNNGRKQIVSGGRYGQSPPIQTYTWIQNVSGITTYLNDKEPLKNNKPVLDEIYPLDIRHETSEILGYKKIIFNEYIIDDDGFNNIEEVKLELKDSNNNIVLNNKTMIGKQSIDTAGVFEANYTVDSSDETGYWNVRTYANGTHNLKANESLGNILVVTDDCEYNGSLGNNVTLKDDCSPDVTFDFRNFTEVNLGLNNNFYMSDIKLNLNTKKRFTFKNINVNNERIIFNNNVTYNISQASNDVDLDLYNYSYFNKFDHKIRSDVAQTVDFYMKGLNNEYNIYYDDNLITKSDSFSIDTTTSYNQLTYEYEYENISITVDKPEEFYASALHNIIYDITAETDAGLIKKFDLDCYDDNGTTAYQYYEDEINDTYYNYYDSGFTYYNYVGNITCFLTVSKTDRERTINFSYGIRESKLKNFTAYNKYNKTPINNFNVSINDYETREYQTTDGKIENAVVYNTTHTIKSNAENYTNKVTRNYNDTGYNDTLNFSFWKSKLTIDIVNRQAENPIPNAYVVVYKEGEEQYKQEYNNITTDNLKFYLDKGSYKINVSSNTINNTQFNYTITENGNYEQTYYVLPRINFILRNERTRELFNISGPQDIEQKIFCEAGDVINRNITSNTFYFEPSCKFTKVRYTVTYASDSYYRTLLSGAFNYTQQNTTLWLVDLLDSQVIFNTFELYDLTSKYDNLRIFFSKNIDGKEYVITSDELSVEDKVGTYLLLGEQYNIEVVSDNLPTIDLGFYLADAPGEKVLRLFDIRFDPQRDTEWSRDSWGLELLNDTTHGRIKTTFSSPNAELVTLKIYNESDDLIHNNSIQNQAEGIFYYPIPKSQANQTYSVRLYLNKTEEYSEFNQVLKGLITADPGIDNQLLIGNFISSQTLNIMIALLLVVLSLLFTYKTANVGSLVIIGAAGMFYYADWLVISGITLGLAILIAFIDYIKVKEREVRGY